MHSHILPEFDDGARSVEESLRLIDCLRKQGITNICLTPHFYTNEQSLEDFVEKRKEAFEKFKPFIPDDINIVLGTEVYVTRYLFGNNDLSQLTYGNSRYILTEFAYDSRFSSRTMDKLCKLIDNYGLTPVIPHVERYPALMDNISMIEELREMGVLIQTNISNYTSKAPMFKRRKLLKLINKELIDILGSDAHSMRHNTPEVYSEAINCIAAKCGQQAVDRMMNNAEKIFNRAI